MADDLDQMDKKITFFAPTNEAFDRLKDIMGEKDYEEVRGMGRRRGDEPVKLEEAS